MGRRSIANRWPERLTALLCVTLLSLPTALSANIRTSFTAATDFKTLYASAWCLVHGANAYTIPNIATVYTAGGIILPPDWYARSPVYPPFTLSLLAPLTALPIVLASRAWLILSAGLFACALAALARVAATQYRLSLPLRLLLIVAASVFPPAVAALFLGNVSVIVSSLCILAVCADGTRNSWPRAIALTAALLLKPHSAGWVVVALLFLPHLRTLIPKVATLSVAWLTLTTAWLATKGQLTMQLYAYRSLLSSELTSGSMSAHPAGHAAGMLSTTIQVTSLQSLAAPFASSALVTLLLAALLLLLLALSWRTCHLATPDALVAAWFSFGLIATYHRAHDSTLLLLLLPAIFSLIHHSPLRLTGWVALLLLACFSLPLAHWLRASPAIADHQAALAALLLAISLTAHLASTHATDHAPPA